MFEKLTELAHDSLFLNTGIHIEGNKELIIENCSRIEEYNEVFMRLISGNLCVQIWGSELRAYDFKTKGLIVRGKISQIEFIERGSKEHEKSAERLREDKR